MTPKQALTKLHKTASDVASNLDHAGRLSLFQQIELQKVLAEVETFMKQGTNSKSAKKKLAKIKQLLTVLKRHLSPKSTSPYARVVRLDKGVVTVTDFYTATTFDLGLWPEVECTAIEIDDLSKMGGFDTEEKVEKFVKVWYTLEVSTAYSEQGYTHTTAIDEEFSSEEEAEKYFSTSYETPSDLLFKGHSINRHEEVTFSQQGKSVTFTPEDWLDINIKIDKGEALWQGPLTLDKLDLMARVGMAAATDESRPPLQGVCFKEDIFISADGFQLIKADSGLGHLELAMEDYECLFPADHITNILKTVKSLGEYEFILTIYQKHYEVKGERVSFVGQWIPGEFPSNYNNIIPTREEDAIEFEFGPEVGPMFKDIVATHRATNPAQLKMVFGLDECQAKYEETTYTLPIKASKEIEGYFDVVYLKTLFSALNPSKGFINGNGGVISTPLTLEKDGMIAVLMPMHP